MKVSRQLIVVASLVIIVTLFLRVFMRPAFTQDGLVMLIHGQNERSEYETTVVYLGRNGLRWKTFSGWFSYSPDAQFLKSTYTRPSHMGLTVIKINTLETICFDIKSTNLNPYGCESLQLYNGKWWSPSTGGIVERRGAVLGEAIGAVSQSPSQNWNVAQTTGAYIIEGAWKYGVISFAHTSLDIDWLLDIPKVDGEFCFVGNDYDWSEDSTLFAMWHGRQNFTFIWQLDQQGEKPPKLIASEAIADCSKDGYWERGQFIGGWPSID